MENRIRDVFILTQNSNRDVVYGDIVIEDKRIRHIIPKMGYPDTATYRVAVPAFSNLHIHLGETIFRGRCDGMDLFQYLDVSHLSYENSLWKRNEERIHSLSGLITFIECLKNGCGIFACSRGWEEAKRTGIKAVCMYPIVNISKLDSYYKGIDSIVSFKDHEDSRQRVKNSIFLQSLYLADEDKIDTIARLLEQNHNLKLFVHIAETEREIRYIYDKYQCSPIELLYKKGILSERVFCIHCIYLSAEDLRLIKETKSNVIICPVSNLKLKSGFPDVHKMIEKGISLSVATDGFATNNSASLLEELKLLGLMTKGDIGAYKLLDMITVNPAQALNPDEKAGCLAEGAIADISVFSGPKYLFYDRQRIVNHLIYDYTDFFCEDVFLDGESVLSEGMPTLLKHKDIYDEYYNLLCELFELDSLNILADSL